MRDLSHTSNRIAEAIEERQRVIDRCSLDDALELRVEIESSMKMLIARLHLLEQDKQELNRHISRLQIRVEPTEICPPVKGPGDKKRGTVKSLGMIVKGLKGLSREQIIQLEGLLSGGDDDGD